MSSAGVSELMDAEKKASTVVAEARAQRSDRLKAAKAEAGAAVDDLRAARESEHALTTSSESDVIGADGEQALCPWRTSRGRATSDQYCGTTASATAS